jgi:hypothetical protein
MTCQARRAAPPVCYIRDMSAVSLLTLLGRSRLALREH